MITALSVKAAEPPKGIAKLTRRFRRDKISVNIERVRGVTLKHITYLSYSGQLRLDKTDGAVGEQRSRLLCSENLVFPRHSGYKRFCSNEFQSRLCTNAALYAVGKLRDKNVRVGLLDLPGRHAEFMLDLLEECADVLVVTNNPGVYSKALDIALEELGASAAVGKNPGDLISRDLIVSPEAVYQSVPVKDGSAVLAVSPPEDGQRGRWYSHYRVKMPNGFDLIKPGELSGEYFCSALYTLGSQYELGSMLPVALENENTSTTLSGFIASLANSL